MKTIAALALFGVALWLNAQTAQNMPHLTAGPGTPPSVMALVGEAHALKVENDTLRAENAVLRGQIASLEANIVDILQTRSRESGLRVPQSLPSGKTP